MSVFSLGMLGLLMTTLVRFSYALNGMLNLHELGPRVRRRRLAAAMRCVALLEVLIGVFLCASGSAENGFVLPILGVGFWLYARYLVRKWPYPFLEFP